MSAPTTEAEELTVEERLDAIRNHCLYGEGEAAEGDWHEDADKFSDSDLLDMFEYDENFCPLHVKASYPLAVQGEVARQYVHAHRRLVEHSVAHTGADRRERAEDGRWHYHATAGELRELWADYPHARHVFEQDAKAGDVTIHVVEP